MRKIKTLLVDDSEGFLDVASGFFMAEERIEVIGRALSGEEAVEAARRDLPDLVIMDIAMPGMGGLKASSLIKKISGAPRIVMLTLYDNPEYRLAAKEIGIDGFVSKSEFASRLMPLIYSLFPSEDDVMVREEQSVRRVLIVDDSRTLRKMVIACLVRLPGVQFQEAVNGLDAIEKLALQPFDLMVLDLNMPDMHGMEVIRFLRTHDAYREIPILVLTTKSDQTTRSSALSAGATSYMTKPFDPRELFREASRLLKLEKEALQ